MQSDLNLMKIKLHIPKSSKCNKIERVADMLSQVEVWDYMQVWVFEMINYLRMCSHDEYSWNTAHLTIKQQLIDFLHIPDLILKLHALISF